MSEGMRNYETMGRLEMQRDLDAIRAENARLREAVSIVEDWPLVIEDRLGLLDRLAREGVK